MKEIETDKGNIFLIDDKSQLFNDAISLIELAFSGTADTLVLYRENLPETFFELKSGLAGDILQKFSNYQKRLVILGEFASFNSKSLNDFIYESNKNGKVIFSDTLENALPLLK